MGLDHASCGRLQEFKKTMKDKLSVQMWSLLLIRVGRLRKILIKLLRLGKLCVFWIARWSLAEDGRTLREGSTVFIDLYRVSITVLTS